MTSTPMDPAATAYLRALEVRLEPADADVRAEILADVREHIAIRLDELGHPPSPAEVRAVLTDVGSPVEVADEALLRTGVRPSRRLAGRWVPATYATLSAVGATLILAVGEETRPEWFWSTGWVLVVGAVATLCVAPLWTSVEKVVGILAGLGVTFAVFMVLAYADVDDAAARSLVGLLAVVVSLVAPAWLAWRAWQRSPAMSWLRARPDGPRP